MERNISLLGWWWWLRFFWLGEAIWVIYLTEEHGLSLGQILFFEAAYAASVLVTEIPSGILADRFGRRWVLFASAVIFVLGLLAFGLGEGLLLLLMAYAAFGISDAAASGADQALLYDSLAPVGRTDEFEPKLGRFNALVMGGFAFMTIAGSLMVRWTPLSTPILLSAALTLPSLLLILRMTDPPRRSGRTSVRAIGGGALKRIATTRAMWSVVLINGVSTVTIALMAVLQQPLLLKFGFPVWSLGLFVAVQLFVGAGGAWVAGAAGLRLGLRRVFLVVPVVSALSLLAGVSDWPWMYAFFLLPGAGYHLVFTNASGFLSRRVNEHERATVISTASMVSSSATVAVTPVIGVLVDGSSLDTGLIAASFGLAAVALLAYLAWWTSGDTTRDPASPPADQPPHAPAPSSSPDPVVTEDGVPTFVFPRRRP
jgi:MFS family permease